MVRIIPPRGGLVPLSGAATAAVMRPGRMVTLPSNRRIVAYYIDPSFGPGGDGSYSSPWDDFTEVNALSGDLGGRIIRLKSGQTIYDGLSISNASNFAVETYGGSTKAIIDGSALTGWTWVNAGGDLWSTATPGAEKAIWVGDVAFERAGEGATTPLQSVMDRNEYTFWYGTHSTYGGGNLLWVHAPTGMDMNAEEAANHVRTTSENVVAYMSGCSAAAVRSIQMQRGFNAVFQAASHGAGLTIDDVVSRWCGKGTVGQDLIDISGASAVAPATSVVLSDSQFYENFGGSNNNATEFSWVTGLTISNCNYRRIAGNAVEFWQTIKNGRVTRCRFEEIGGSIWWLSNSIAGQEHDNNQMDNCISTTLGTMFNDGGTDQQGSQLLRHQAGTNTRLYHNTHITNNIQAVTLAAGTSAACLNTVTMKNNIFVSLQSYASRARFQTLDSPTPAWTFVSALTGAKNEIVSDNNRIFSRYATDQNTTRVGYLNAVGSYTTGLAAWQAQTGNPDPNSSEGDPLLAAMFGTSAASTTMASVGTAGAWTMTVTSSAGMAVGGFVAVPMAASPRLHFTRIMAIAGNVLTGELKIGGGGISNGAAVTYYAEIQTDATPSASGVLNSGVGSVSDPLIPATDFYGSTRSATTPDIGAIEA